MLRTDSLFKQLDQQKNSLNWDFFHKEEFSENDFTILKSKIRNQTY